MPTRMTRSPSPPEATRSATTHQGLSAAEAARRLAADGPNMLPGSAPKSSWAIVRDVLTEPMFLMLLAVFVLQGFPLGVQGFQLAIGLPGGGVGLLPVQVQGFQGFGRFAGSQSAQFGGGGFECRVGFEQFAVGFLGDLVNPEYWFRG